ncbi:MAG: polyphenol oxidase family protein [Coriobacteriia bacterium]|nr:polyphenol oxidase family protein [Coriobacteriia bacterium]
MSEDHIPNLVRVERGSVAFWTDTVLRQAGVLVAFSERSGGVSKPPFASLNFAGHVGDDPAAVDENRSLFLRALDIAELRGSLTMGRSAQADGIAIVGHDEVGAGAFVSSGKPAVNGVDCLITSLPRIPLLQSYADCVPIVVVAPGPVVAFVHAGWRGALASLPGKAVARIAQVASCDVAEIHAYVGAHIRDCHYEIDGQLMSQFVNTFGTFARAESGGLDLDAVVSASLERAGVTRCNIARLGMCTAETTDRFFSHRAEGGLTGRHAALVCIL